MVNFVSGIIRRPVFLSVKNEEDGQRVKRRRVMRKRQFDGGSVAKPGHCDIKRSLNTLLEPSGRKPQLAAPVKSLGGDNLSKKYSE